MDPHVGDGVHQVDPGRRIAEFRRPLELEPDGLGSLPRLVVVDQDAETLDAAVARVDLYLAVVEVVVPVPARSLRGGGGVLVVGKDFDDRAMQDRAGNRAAGNLEDLGADRPVGGLHHPIGDVALVILPSKIGVGGRIDRGRVAAGRDGVGRAGQHQHGTRGQEQAGPPAARVSARPEQPAAARGPDRGGMPGLDAGGLCIRLLTVCRGHAPSPELNLSPDLGPL